MPEAKSAKDGQKKVITLFGATQKFAQQGGCFRDVSVKTKERPERHRRPLERLI
jgi:hypothetical protein